MSDSGIPSYSLGQLLRYMLALGTWGFGGPVALVGYMYRDLVERRQWIADADYKEGITLAQLMPGPLAAQLAIYLGFVHYRLLGATLVGVAFVLPSFVIVVAIGAVYVSFGGIPWMQAVFYGVGACVIGIIAMSSWKLTRKSIGSDKLLWSIYLASGVMTVLTQSESVWLFVGAGLVVWWIRARPTRWFDGRLHALGGPALFVALALTALPDWPTLGQIAAFFTYAGTFVFGSGLAIVPFLYGGVVTEHHWLNDRQFLDAIAVAMITPGPVVITTGFIGFLIAGFWGALVAALATFLPCYILTVLPAPYFKKHGKHPGIVAFVDGVTAAAVGALTGAVIVIAQRSVTDLITAAIAVGTTALLWQYKRLPEPVIVIIAALLGLLLHPLANHS
ncbi:chromate transporter [Rhizobacter sp. Root404]|uniref:chromate transporter n=1 Tax=Rhizobacter sp. Root404 TaxID=1736528 RepID=UPI0006F819C9|nr:chromate transporter [Rhizobacter sp. Root404]KQW38387.1 chromate transporter [Rhizobacter sp. Root404]